MEYISAEIATNWWSSRLKISLNKQIKPKFEKLSIFLLKQQTDYFQQLLKKTLNKKLKKKYDIELDWTQGILKDIKEKCKINSNVANELNDFKMVVNYDTVEIYIKEQTNPYLVIYDQSMEEKQF
ncbi:MAG: hypothetical protein PHS54_02605 [Clostridia bacterium]|nr:hypothetical protein [Clostridia bacterium]